MLEESWNSGNIIGIPSLDIRTAKVDGVFPTPPKTAEEVIDGLLSGFPHASLITEGDNPTHIQAAMKWPTYAEWENTYIAVNTEGLHQPAPSTPEEIDLRVGELVISRSPRSDLEINQILSSPAKITMEPGIAYRIRSRQDWAIYHHETTSLPRPRSK